MLGELKSRLKEGQILMVWKRLDGNAGYSEGKCILASGHKMLFNKTESVSFFGIWGIVFEI